MGSRESPSSGKGLRRKLPRYSLLRVGEYRRGKSSLLCLFLGVRSVRHCKCRDKKCLKVSSLQGIIAFYRHQACKNPPFYLPLPCRWRFFGRELSYDLWHRDVPDGKLMHWVWNRHIPSCRPIHYLKKHLHSIAWVIVPISRHVGAYTFPCPETKLRTWKYIWKTIKLRFWLYYA